MSHDVTTSLRSDIAALQYKRDRLLSEVRIYSWKEKVVGMLKATDSTLQKVQFELHILQEL